MRWLLISEGKVVEVIEKVGNIKSEEHEGIIFDTVQDDPDCTMNVGDIYTADIFIQKNASRFPTMNNPDSPSDTIIFPTQ